MNKDFLIEVFLSNTQSASFQRGRVYAQCATPEAIAKFQDGFRKRLRELEQHYARRVSDEEHCRVIQEFAEGLSRSHPDALANGKFRIGIAQKAINLFLKYLWSVGLIPEPPHCPVDRIVLTETAIWENWTELDDMCRYRSIIQTLRQHAGKQQLSLAQWELRLWQRNACTRNTE